jgi:hypothetical protein
MSDGPLSFFNDVTRLPGGPKALRADARRGGHGLSSQEELMGNNPERSCRDCSSGG